MNVLDYCYGTWVYLYNDNEYVHVVSMGLEYSSKADFWDVAQAIGYMTALCGQKIPKEHFGKLKAAIPGFLEHAADDFPWCPACALVIHCD